MDHPKSWMNRMLRRRLRGLSLIAGSAYVSWVRRLCEVGPCSVGVVGVPVLGRGVGEESSQHCSTLDDIDGEP